MKKIYFAVIHSEKDGYCAEIPDLQNCMADGDTIEETILALRRCAQLAVEYRTDEKKNICPPTSFEIMKKKYKGEVLMPVEIVPPMKAQRINITVPAHVLEMIDYAVAKEHSNRSDFMVRAARAAAAMMI